MEEEVPPSLEEVLAGIDQDEEALVSRNTFFQLSNGGALETDNSIDHLNKTLKLKGRADPRDSVSRTMLHHVHQQRAAEPSTVETARMQTGDSSSATSSNDDAFQFKARKARWSRDTASSLQSATPFYGGKQPHVLDEGPLF